jgi:hypothetical protein
MPPLKERQMAYDQQLADALREIGRLKASIRDAIEAGDFRLTAPCILCGYSGPGFYQPKQHHCSALDATNGP